MDELRDRGLLFKLRAYAGWNTPTNSTGFVIGEGMLAKHMKDEPSTTCCSRATSTTGLIRPMCATRSRAS